ncbi:MAG TPA: GTPase HflX, partial [Armatimonadota bacterium]|nr:GTPase HflX [Armatimonadota bacterium]
TLPRLTGRGTMMSRIGGGSRAGSGPMGTRGPGRTKLEVDRSRIQQRMNRLRKTLGEVEQRRELSRANRQGANRSSISLIGYTNAGKSSLLNALAGGEEVSTRNRLFETLDTTTRRIEIAENREAVISDTVGFVRHLPHHLVAAFRATLVEAAAAELLVQVIDASDPDREKQMEATLEVLGDLDAADTPMIYALNKIDLLADREDVEAAAAELPNAVLTSATTGEGIDRLRELMDALAEDPLASVTLEVPYDAMGALNIPPEQGRVVNFQYEDDRVIAQAELGPAALGRLKAYIVAEG